MNQLQVWWRKSISVVQHVFIKGCQGDLITSSQRFCHHRRYTWTTVFRAFQRRIGNLLKLHRWKKLVSATWFFKLVIYLVVHPRMEPKILQNSPPNAPWKNLIISCFFFNLRTFGENTPNIYSTRFPLLWTAYSSTLDIASLFTLSIQSRKGSFCFFWPFWQGFGQLQELGDRNNVWRFFFTFYSNNVQ